MGGFKLLFQAGSEIFWKRNSEPGDVSNKGDHLVLFNGARAILVEFLKALLELLVTHTFTIAHIAQGVFDELTSLFFVK